MKTRAELALICATFFWGITFPFIRIVLHEISPMQLVFLRGTIAALIFLPFVLIVKRNRQNFFRVLPWGALLGVLYFTSYYTQSVGLETISSGRSAFITNLTVIFVPFLSPLFGRGVPNKNDLISCLIAIFGIYFLTNPFGKTGLVIGDLWTLVTAISFTLQIHLLQHVLEKKPFSTLFAFWQVAFVGLNAFALKFFVAPSPNFFPQSAMGIFSLLYLGVVALVICTWLQTKFQHQTTPERAAVIYIIEPLFACAFGFLLLHETMTLKSLFGGFLIIFAVLWTYIYHFIKNNWNKHLNGCQR